METLTHSYTLSELCSEIRSALSCSLEPSYWVHAEISSLSIRSGHAYFELVDGKSAKLRAVCWSNVRELLFPYFQSETGQTLQPGMRVMVEVEVNFHPLYGLSVSIVNIEPSYTLGDQARERQLTIERLRSNGLIVAQQQLSLPTLIQHIAVISSPFAAGYDDFRHQLDNSGFRFTSSLYGAVMQGQGAEASILAALEEVEKDYAEYDCVVIIRGGGAVTDLSCFDNYNLCAAAAEFPLPVITGIGHTKDVSVLDMVAYQSLKTPTAVAEWLIHRSLTQSRIIEELYTRLHRTAERQILIRKHKVEMLAQRLSACNPERFYRLGYSLLTKDGKPVRTAEQLSKGDVLRAHLMDGTVELVVS